MNNHAKCLNRASPKVFNILLLGATLALYCYANFAIASVDLPIWQRFQMQGNPSLRGAAIDNNSMWVTGSNNSVFVSQDGGETWLDKSVKSTIKTGFRDIALFDHQTAIVMGAGNGESSMLYKTTDGGDNWHLLYQNIDETGFFDSIDFWDKETGLLLGDPVDGYYVVKKTEDGGKTWRRITKNKLPKMLANEAAFSASGSTLITGKNGKAYITTGGLSASVYISDNYGESWQRHVVPLYQATKTAGGYGLALNHLGQPFVLGGDYEQRPKNYANMATLLNGSWQKVASGKNGLRTSMSCQGNICISTGKTNSDISYDNGKTWQLFPNEKGAENNKGFYTIVSDNGKFLAAGSIGKIVVLSFK